MKSYAAASRRPSAAPCAFMILLALSFLLCTTLRAHAQDLDDVTISGQVRDQNGAIVPGATVTALLIATGGERSVETDTGGRYRIIELSPGIYTVRVSFQGFATEEKTELATFAGDNVRLDITLRPAEVTAEQVVVSEAETPAVDTTRTVVGGTVTTEEVESLPNVSRDPLDLIFTLGGVTEEPLSTRDLAEDRNTSPNGTPEEAGSFALSGGPAYSNNITIDGLDNNDDRAARERFQPSVEAVEEVQVITNQFSAEYGRASGGRINIRTRAGSSRYRGRLFYFFRDESLDANTFNNNARGLGRLPLQQHNPGFTLGGPLRLPRQLFGPLSYDGRKRTFFFVAYEYNTTLDTALIDTLVPVTQNPRFPLPMPSTFVGERTEDAPGVADEDQVRVAPFISTVSTPIKNHIFTARVDHIFTDVHNGTFSYQMGRLKNLRQFGGGFRLAEALQGRTRNSDAISYSDNWVFSPRAVNQMRIQYSRLAPAIEAQGGAGPVVLININDTLLSSDPAERSGTLVAGSSTTGGSDRREDRWQVQDAFSYIIGAHSLKVGGDYQKIRSTFIDLSDITGTFNFRSVHDFLNNAPSRFRQNFQAESTQNNTYVGLFVQDEWRLLSNLVLSYGLRYERESIIRDLNNFGPRFALAYDPFKSGKTVIRVGAGLFYNRALLRTIDDFTLGKQQLFFDTSAIAEKGVLCRNLHEDCPMLASSLAFPKALTAGSPLVKQFGLLDTNFSRRLSPDLRIPESYQANLGFEREIGGGFVFEANYTFNRGIHLWREFNANAPRLPKGFKDFAEYLLSRDFENQVNGGVRPIYNASGAGDRVRFTLAPFNEVVDPNGPCGASFNPTNPDVGGCVDEAGVAITLINLNSFSSGTPVDVALAALNDLRPDPSLTEVEQLASIGNSFYHGLTLELRRRFHRSKSGLGFSFRAAYTFSRLTDDGIVNTSDALRVADFRAERSRSLLDRRHRFVFSGTLDTPRYLGSLRFSPIVRVASGAPFNISLGGVDRNLDDVSNDRPIFTGDASLLRARRPGDPLNQAVLQFFGLPTIGRTGNMARNSGSGLGFFLFDINITREFRLTERTRLRPTIEINNVLNKTVFSFGTEFIDFRAFGAAATPAQQQAFLDSFLLTTRTLRPRTIRVGIRFDF
ncbi:MAG TPA: TonB-dependent receptor [Pyrinomonadaceae bacterium]